MADNSPYNRHNTRVSSTGEQLGSLVHHSPSKLDRLSHELVEGSYQQRFDASCELAGCLEAKEILLVAYESEEDPEIKTQILYSLGSLGRFVPEIEERLLQSVSEKRLQQASAWAIGKVCTPSEEVTQALLNIVAEASKTVRDIVEHTFIEFDTTQESSSNPLAAFGKLPLVERVCGSGANVAINDNGEELEAVGAFSDTSASVAVHAYLFGEGVRATCKESGVYGAPVERTLSLLTPFLRKGVVREILKPLSERLLENLLCPVVYDAYRPPELQLAIFKKYQQCDDEHACNYEQPIFEKEGGECALFCSGAAFELRLCELKPLGAQLLRQVSILEEESGFEASRLPVTVDGLRVANTNLEIELHNRFEGNDAYELTDRLARELVEEWLLAVRPEYARQFIFRRFGKEQDIGCAPGEFSKRSVVHYFESELLHRKLNEAELEQLTHRRVLHNIVESLGAATYPARAGVFTYGDRNWAVARGEPTARYGGALLSDENKAFESLRRAVWSAVAPIAIIEQD